MSIATRDLYSLGLDDHDRLNKELGGGIPPGSIVLVEGDYGAGKSAMSQRFTYGLCEEGTMVTTLSTELTVGSFLEQMHSLAYDMVDHMLDEEAIGLFWSIADVFLELEMVEVGQEVRRQINVLRFAGMGEQVGDTIGFSVRSGTGIVIESRSVA